MKIENLWSDTKTKTSKFGVAANLTKAMQHLRSFKNYVILLNEKDTLDSIYLYYGEIILKQVNVNEWIIYK